MLKSRTFERIRYVLELLFLKLAAHEKKTLLLCTKLADRSFPHGIHLKINIYIDGQKKRYMQDLG